MARPISNTAEYFSHDADMRNDIKIKALRRKFGHTGYAVWNYILETLTDSNDFELDFAEVNRELLAADYDVTVEELYNIVKYACSINLLQLSKDETTLYSNVLKKRFSQLIEQRDKRSKAGKKGMESRWSNDNNVITNDNNVITKNNKVKETIGKENKEKEKSIIYPFQDIVALWNEICGTSLPKVKSLTDDRRQKIKCRLTEFGGVNKEKWLANAKEIFERITASDFLCGNNGNQWTATFDWVFENSKNWIKVLEGNYDNNRGKRASPPQQDDVTLGIGEYIDAKTGRRTYGTGRATIPTEAPPRPSERHSWDSVSKSWVLL